MNEQQPQRLLSGAEVADWLQVSRAWVLSHANGQRKPVLPRVKVGKCVRFRRADVDAFIKECQELAK
jgi:predicted DNA-binding transcriptional regulator AlpA